LFADLQGRRVLVVGGGPAGVEKAKRLSRIGAVVVVVDPTPSAELDRLENVTIERRAFADDDVRGAWLVVTATADRSVNEHVAAVSERERVWVNRADLPDGGPVALGACMERGRVRVAVSTGGASPALARWVRGQIDEALPAEVAELAELLVERRREGSRGHRALSFDALLDALREGDHARVVALLDRS
jgi:siroheme synthase-like protein